MLLIDAWNLLHATATRAEPLADLDVRSLVAVLARTRWAGTKTMLVCDGPRPGSGHAAPGAATIAEARIIYTGATREADDQIEQILESCSFARRITVVSSDKRLRRAAKRAGAHWLSAQAFCKQIEADLARAKREPVPAFAREIPLGPYAVDHWMREFALPDDWGPRVDPSPIQPPSADPPAEPAPPTEPPPSRPTPSIDPETRRLLDEYAIEEADLDMDQYLPDDP